MATCSSTYVCTCFSVAGHSEAWTGRSEPPTAQRVSLPAHARFVQTLASPPTASCPAAVPPLPAPGDPAPCDPALPPTRSGWSDRRRPPAHLPPGTAAYSLASRCQSRTNDSDGRSSLSRTDRTRSGRLGANRASSLESVLRKSQSDERRWAAGALKGTLPSGSGPGGVLWSRGQRFLVTAS